MFAYRLALSLGVWDVQGMLDRMPARQLMEWIAYAELEPFGEGRADLRAGIVASTVANVHRRAGRASYKAQDFMPTFNSRKQTPKEMAAIVLNAVRMVRGRV